jgi:hypothetical protein
MDQGPGDAGYAKVCQSLSKRLSAEGNRERREESGMASHSSFCALSGDLIAKLGSPVET